MTKRYDSNLKAEANYRAKKKRILINIDVEEEAALLAWLRSQVKEDSEIPALIKRILNKNITERKIE